MTYDDYIALHAHIGVPYRYALLAERKRAEAEACRGKLYRLYR